MSGGDEAAPEWDTFPHYRLLNYELITTLDHIFPPESTNFVDFLKKEATVYAIVKTLITIVRMCELRAKKEYFREMKSPSTKDISLLQDNGVKKLTVDENNITIFLSLFGQQPVNVNIQKTGYEIFRECFKKPETWALFDVYEPDHIQVLKVNNDFFFMDFADRCLITL